MNFSVDDASLATRSSLLGRMKDWGDGESWQDFFNKYWRLIYNVALKAGLSDADARDVVQETILAVAKQLPTFQYNRKVGSFKGWLLTITSRRIIDALRKMKRRNAFNHPPASDSDATPLIETVPDPASLDLNAVWDDEWERNLCESAIERVKRKAKPKQYQLFDCFVLRETPMAEVRRRFGVSMGQVYFAKYKVGAMVAEELRRLRKTIS